MRNTVTRRELLLAGAAGATGLLNGLLPSSRAQAAIARAKPNIIFILADDLGVADVSCYGAPEIKTPAIDEIAREGARFTQAYANSAVCTASRTALITGRYQYRLRVGLEEPLALSKSVGLPAEQPTLPSILKKAGYQTWLIGKWHLGELPNFGPLKSGYDHFYGFRGGTLDYFSHKFGAESDFWEDAGPIEQHGYLTDLLGQRAVQVIQAHAGNPAPLFMSLHFNAPHWPWQGPGDEAASKRTDGKMAGPEGGTLQTYNLMVEALDRQIGLVLEALAQSGQADDTMVVFTSDNGGERFSNTWPFTGKKSELLEGGLRIPAAIRWPGHIPGGLVSTQTMMLMDWLPTLTAAAGTGPDAGSPTDGMNLLPVLTQGAPVHSRKLFWRYKANAQRAMRDGDYKVLKIAGNTFLFNVVDDPLERANLRSRFPEIYQRMTAEWTAWNKTMLPESPDSMTYNNTGAEWADHINTATVDPKAVDDGLIWPTQPEPSFGPPGLGAGPPGDQ
jgi:arylsulfatase A-like enzyme